MYAGHSSQLLCHMHMTWFQLHNVILIVLNGIRNKFFHEKLYLVYQ